jgi:hypothetical protein
MEKMFIIIKQSSFQKMLIKFKEKRFYRIGSKRILRKTISFDFQVESAFSNGRLKKGFTLLAKKRI